MVKKVIHVFAVVCFLSCSSKEEQCEANSSLIQTPYAYKFMLLFVDDKKTYSNACVANSWGINDFTQVLVPINLYPMKPIYFVISLLILTTAPAQTFKKSVLKVLILFL